MTRIFRNSLAPLLAAGAALVVSPVVADQVILDDLIVDGSACIGQDCVNGESFGFDTIRLKENNLRIRFFDTSSTSSFPSNDWQITANESINGGANKFSIDDIDNSRIPFTIEAASPSNSLYVDSGGRLGFGTNNPVVELHVVDGDTPTLRLEQDGSSGFTPQTWDLAGNETNFFVRDVTNGSRLPFRIRPGAETSSIDIDGSGQVRIGTDGTARGRLHVRGNSTGDTGTVLFLENINATGQTVFQLLNGFGDQWAFRAQNNGFGINYAGNPGLEFRVAENGDVFVNTVMVHSSRTVKENFASVDPARTLARVADLPISEWNYKTGSPGVRHVGPTAEDFHAAFGLSDDPTRLAITDTSGVALVAIQGLVKELEARDASIAELEARLAALEAAVASPQP
jgi:hypothetical protein